MPQSHDISRRRTDCRLCGSSEIALVLELAPTPPANAFVTADNLNQHQNKFPLNVFFCEACTHVQILDIVDPSVLFRDYVYVSGTSPIFVQHFEKYANLLVNRYSVPAGGLAIDIGSSEIQDNA